ncbi:LAFE_0G02410g1_1 [Lachancea fermentati]|uniref:LAFE_0G02410g1_1 n=1 Tax=Lachancea fermentati TaxID=4955 RepID=A0A1G4MGS6_LACFM|nr:LAFE_0G02410g1_1 [Lachancea fermentati]
MAQTDKDGISNNEDEEQFYENLDELRELIGDDHSGKRNDAKESNLADEFSDMEGHEDDMIDEELTALEGKEFSEGTGGMGGHDEFAYRDDDDLLAEFSDYGDFSDDEYDEQDFMDAIREANNFKVKRKGRNKKKATGKVTTPKMRKDRIVDPEVAQLLSEANEAFVRTDIQVAEQLYNEVIKKDVKNFAAYKTLGDIYQLQERYNDCCNSWFLAAHLNSSDWEFWKVVATLSADLGHIRQAIYCYTRAIRMNNEEWECIYNRSILYKKTGQLGRALEGFQKLYSNDPYDANILRELAVLYVEYNRINEAIALYVKVFEANIERRNAIVAASENAVESSEDEQDDSEGESDQDYEEDDDEVQYYSNASMKKTLRKYRCIKFDWSSLNILAELFLKQAGENSGIKTIKRCARWIQHREMQTFWDDISDDSEFDKRRFRNSRYDALSVEEKEKSYILPIDIRIRLGLLRLNNKHVLEAMNHFQFLYDEVFVDIADLYFEVAVALTKAEKYQEAIEFFTPLLNLDDYRTIDVYKPLSKCYKEVEDYSKARQAFEKLVQLKPEDLETKLTLAEINYHLGNHDTFNKLLLEVVETRKQQASESRAKLTDDHLQSSESMNDSIRVEKGKPLLEDIHTKKASVKKKRTPQDAEKEKRDRERRITAKVLDKYNKLKIYKEGMEAGEENQTTLWIDTASDLIDVFSSVKNFFVKSRSKKFVGIIKRTRKFNKVIDYKIERLSKLSEGDNLLDGLPLMEERVILTSATELRGLTYDQWFELFMELALTITKLQSVEDGLSIIETAQEVNVFVQDPGRVKMMKFVKLAIVLQMEDEGELVDNLRGILNQFQFNRKVLHNFMYCVTRGQMSLDVLSSTVQQKFFLRQLKAYDSVRYEQHIAGQASVTNKKVFNPDGEISPYLYYIYAVLLYSSKGFLLALQYLRRLKPHLSEDPMLNFLMGLAHLHRSMQRLTASRHFQILQGLRYLYQYYDIRSKKYTAKEKQEADYNIGRAFHLLGLFSLAIKYYRRVLHEYSDVMLKKHAAYNSILIYNESGNSELANSLMEKYLSI